jgi:hypothetical protein
MSDYLSRDEINKLVGELVNIGVSYEEKRDLFLYGIDPGYTTTLPKKGDAQDQILSDLIKMNQVRYLHNNQIPLAIWLENVTSWLESSRRPEQNLFKETLGRVKIKSTDFRQETAKQETEDSQSIDQSGEDLLELGERIKLVKVDRDKEREIFAQMIENQTTFHILLIEAESGMGKTTLLNEYLELSEGLKTANVNLKQARNFTLGDILAEICHGYGPVSQFTAFTDKCTEILDRANRSFRSPDQVFTVINGLMDELREQYPIKYKNNRRELTDAFLADLNVMHEAVQHPLLLIIDSYELAFDPVKEWIEEDLCIQSRWKPWFICVIAGIQTPQTAIHDWCEKHTLQGLSPEHVREYILSVKPETEEILIEYVIKHSKGNPQKLQLMVLDL